MNARDLKNKMADLSLEITSIKWRALQDVGVTMAQSLERHIMDEKSNSIRDAMVNIVARLGDDEYEADMVDTPRRFTNYLMEFNQGGDLEEALGTVFQTEVDEMVVQTNIPFRAMCAHHLLPFFGEASIGYIPTEKIVGLSKLARLVQAAGVRKPSMQETITDDIVRTVDVVLKPRGVMVVVKAEHTCMAVRGIVTPGVSTITSAVRGVFRDAPHTRIEFFELCKAAKG